MSPDSPVQSRRRAGGGAEQRRRGADVRVRPSRHDPGMDRVPTLGADERAFLAAARTATLATIAPSGRPRLVPICFVVGADAAGGPGAPLQPARRQAEGSRRSARARPGPRHPRPAGGDAPRRPLVGGLVDARLDPAGVPGASCSSPSRGERAEHAARDRRPAGEVPAVRDAPPGRPADPPLHGRPRRGLGRPRPPIRARAGRVSDRGRAPRRAGAGNGSSSSPGGSRRR